MVSRHEFPHPLGKFDSVQSGDREPKISHSRDRLGLPGIYPPNTYLRPNGTVEIVVHLENVPVAGPGLDFAYSPSKRAFPMVGF